MTNAVIRIIETFSPLIPLVIFFTKKSKKTAWSSLLLYYLIVYTFLSFYANFFHLFNIVIYIIISILTFCFFALILEHFLPQQKFRTFNRIVIAITALFFVANAIWGEGTSIFNSYSSGAANLILMAYCVYYYKLQLEKLQTIFVEKLPSFWIVSGVFLYSAGNFFLFCMFNYLTLNYPVFAFYAWDIYIVLILIMNIFFAKGIQCNWEK